MKIIKKSLLVVFLYLATYPLLAKKIENAEGEQYLKNIRRAIGDKTKSALDGKVVEDRIGGDFDNYMDTIIWHDTFEKMTNRIKQSQFISAGKKSIKLDLPLTKLHAKWVAEENKIVKMRKKIEDKNQAIISYFAGGYCTLYDTLSISKSTEYGKLDCLLDFGKGSYRKVEVFTAFYPDYKREIVIAVPVYASFENQNRATFSGIVMNSDKTSFNVSGWVDNKRIQKLLGEGLLMTSDTIYRYSTGYLKALEASRIEERTEYLITQGTSGETITPIETKKVLPPRAEDYLLGAGIELLTNLFTVHGKDYLYSQQPLFAVYPQKLYLEGVVSFDNVGLTKKFGEVLGAEIKKSNTNNQTWLQERNSIIEKHMRTYESKLPTSSN